MFSKLFIERQQAIKMVKDTNFNLLFYTGPSINYNFKNPDLTGIEEISLQLHIEDVSANKAYIDIIDNTSSIWRQAAYNHLYNAIFDKTIYIFYKNNQNLLMAVNNGSNHILTIHNPLDDKYTARIRIYLNILRDRNKSVYGSQANQIFIKEI